MGLFPQRAHGYQPATWYPASEKQVNYLRSLVETTPDAPVAAMDLIKSARIGSREASNAIDHLLRLRQARTAQGVAAPAKATTLTEGMYRLPNGRIFKVQKSENDRLYAKELTKIGGQRLAAGEAVAFEFRYAPGAITMLRPEHTLTLEDAKAFGVQYGVCCCCGRRLKDATSVAAGIGPDCAEKLGVERKAPPVRRFTKSGLAVRAQTPMTVDEAWESLGRAS